MSFSPRYDISISFVPITDTMQRPTDADPAYAAPPVLTVTALNQQVARLLERSFPLVWIGGEISNFTRASSGHWYFTLKDDAAQVRAVMFRSRAQMTGFIPREGDKVEVRGNRGRARLRSWSNRPWAASFSFRRRKAS